MSTSPVVQTEALQRARSGESGANYRVIFEGFIARGIPETDIRPRENVFTYNAWKALGRQVRRGEKGVRCLTFIQTTDKRTGETHRQPWHTTVFHVSQTDAVGANQLPAPKPNSFTPLTAGHNLADGAIDAEFDATGDNVEHAGETEPESWDAAQLAQQRVDARREQRQRDNALLSAVSSGQSITPTFNRVRLQGKIAF